VHWWLLHTCDDTSRVALNHLMVGTQAQNMAERHRGCGVVISGRDVGREGHR